MFLNLIFISDDISRIGSWYLKNFRFHIGDKLAAFDLRRRYLSAVFVLHLIIFALRRDTPAVQARDLPVGIEEDDDGAVLTSTGPQDLVSSADCSPDLVGRYDVDVCLRVEQHGVGLLIVRRQRRANLRMHPRRSIPRRRKPRHKREDTGCDPKQNCERPTLSYWHWRPPAAKQLVLHLPTSLPGKNSAMPGSTSAPATTDPLSACDLDESCSCRSLLSACTEQLCHPDSWQAEGCLLASPPAD